MDFVFYFNYVWLVDLLIVGYIDIVWNINLVYVWIVL